jgi:hypothetical protein
MGGGGLRAMQDRMKQDEKWDEYLKEEDLGKARSKGTLEEMRKKLPNMPLPRPPMPKSYAPKGMAMAVKGDLGAYRQMESQKVTRKKLGGRSIANPLTYRKPETAIDGKFGPGDRVC